MRRLYGRRWSGGEGSLVVASRRWVLRVQRSPRFPPPPPIKSPQALPILQQKKKKQQTKKRPPRKKLRTPQLSSPPTAEQKEEEGWGGKIKKKSMTDPLGKIPCFPEVSGSSWFAATRTSEADAATSSGLSPPQLYGEGGRRDVNGNTGLPKQRGRWEREEDGGGNRGIRSLFAPIIQSEEEFVGGFFWKLSPRLI